MPSAATHQRQVMLILVLQAGSRGKVAQGSASAAAGRRRVAAGQCSAFARCCNLIRSSPVYTTHRLLPAACRSWRARHSHPPCCREKHDLADCATLQSEGGTLI